MTDIGLTSKMFSFSLDGTRVTELLRQLAVSRQRFADRAGHRARNHATAVKMHRFLQVTYRVNSAYWFVAPIIRIITAPRSEDGLPVSRDLPIPMWVPFDTQPSPVYEILYCLQFAFGWAVSETTVLVDVSLIALMLQVSAELAVLNDNLAAGTGPPLLLLPASERDTSDSQLQSPKKSPSSLELPYPDSLQGRTPHADSSKDETYQQLFSTIISLSVAQASCRKC
nr:odorant receptor SameORX [Schistocerca americana]